MKAWVKSLLIALFCRTFPNERLRIIPCKQKESNYGSEHLEVSRVFFPYTEMPYSQVPVLEFNGETLTQVKAIARFVAKKIGTFLSLL